MKDRRAPRLIAVFVVAALLASCAQDQGAEEAQVRMHLSWVPQAQFAGYLVAEAEGFYEDEGLDVEIIPAGPGISPISQMAAGAADITVERLQNLFTARDSGIPLVGVAQFDQESGFRLVAFGDRGIATPEDFRGKTVGMWFNGSEYEFFALMDRFDIDWETELQLVEQGFTVDPFLDGEYDISAVTTWNEYNVILQQGVDPDDLVMFNYAEWDVDMPHGALIVTEEFLEQNRDAVVRFLRATIRGWEHAFENEEEALDIIMEQALEHADVGREHQQLMLQAMRDLHWPAEFDRANHGRIDLGVYERTAQIGFRHGLIERPAAISELVDLDVWAEAMQAN